jgi:hypothetical protein
MPNELDDAIAELRRVTKPGCIWCEDDFATDIFPDPIDRATATILNAVLSGNLIPLDQHNALMAAMVGVGAGKCERAATNDLAYAAKYPDEARKYEDRAHRAEGLSSTIRALTQADATAALERLISRAREEERERCAKVIIAEAASIKAEEADNLAWGGPDPRGADARGFALKQVTKLRKIAAALSEPPAIRADVREG